MEFGDLLFALVNVARKEGIDAESALRASTAKFRSRWAAMEDAAYGSRHRARGWAPSGSTSYGMRSSAPRRPPHRNESPRTPPIAGVRGGFCIGQVRLCGEDRMWALRRALGARASARRAIRSTGRMLALEPDPGAKSEGGAGAGEGDSQAGVEHGDEGLGARPKKRMEMPPVIMIAMMTKEGTSKNERKNRCSSP